MTASLLRGFGNGVWHHFTAPSSGQMVVATFGSGFNTGLVIYSGEENPAVLHFGPMNWKRMLTYATGSVDEELRLTLRNECMVTAKEIWIRKSANKLGALLPAAFTA